ncbi:uncharacterized protein LOC118206057 [Stegodyphus dumicola]|uniref:uncharacterized protein LOC118206057 n=1 Tax=Stegodyphus dumicola TaxID=202533 RepID=UPI0015B17729|nr:uncharacterized protein LOC118206057 [Stegodyphus dumicola]
MFFSAKALRTITLVRTPFVMSAMLTKFILRGICDSINYVRDTLQEVLTHWKSVALRIEEILDSIQFLYKSTVVARYPHLTVSYDTLFGSISKYGQVHSVLSHWIPKTHDCALPEEKIIFRKRNGLIITYQAPEMASTAAWYLPTNIGSFCKALSLESLIEKIASEEAIFYQDEESGTVLVGRDTPMSEEDGFDLRRYFTEIANVVSMNSRKREHQNDYEFLVTYRFITHAILAIYILDGKKFGNGILTVCLRNTEQATQIVKRLSKKERNFVRNIF